MKQIFSTEPFVKRKVPFRKFYKVLSVFFWILSIGFSKPFYAQQSSELVFESSFCEGFEKWVAFPHQETDGVAILGFIYFDSNSGLVFRLERFVTHSQGVFGSFDTDVEYDVSIFKLMRNTRGLHILNENQKNQLDLPQKPSWFKQEPRDAQGLLVLGSHLNGAGCSQQALPFLEKVYEKNKKSPELLFELAYSYNALKQYGKSISILKRALKAHPNSGLLYKESIYANVMLLRLDEAERDFAKYIVHADDLRYQTESAYNIAYGFYLKGDRKRFNEWFEITKMSSNGNSPFLENLELIKSEWE